MIALFTTHGLVLELLASMVIFCLQQDRRARFGLRAAASLACLFLLSLVWSWLPLPDNGWAETLRYTLFCAAGIGVLYFCYRLNPRQSVFIMIGACVAQHFAFKVSSALAALAVSAVPELPSWAVYAPGIVLCDLLLAVTLVRALRSCETRHLTWATVVLLLAGMLLFTNLFQNLFLEYAMAVPLQLRLVFEAFDLICCIFLLALMFELCQRGRLENDNDILKHVLHQQKQQMETSKETIDLINIKCHDLKHQLSRLGPRISPKEIAELNESINVYGATVKTGNEAADVILTEKSLLCERTGIQLDCMVDGAALDHLSPSDIYALFGNMLDNAITAVRQLPAGTPRIIRMKVRRQAGMLSVHCENAFAGTLTFQEGLPVTTKEDRQYHGFGVKSIRMITEKYSGYMTIQTADHLFVLDLLIPLPPA